MYFGFLVLPEVS